MKLKSKGLINSPRGHKSSGRQEQVSAWVHWAEEFCASSQTPSCPGPMGLENGSVSCQRLWHLGTLAGVFVGPTTSRAKEWGVHSRPQSVGSWLSVLSYGPKSDPALGGMTPFTAAMCCIYSWAMLCCSSCLLFVPHLNPHHPRGSSTEEKREVGP